MCGQKAFFLSKLIKYRARRWLSSDNKQCKIDFGSYDVNLVRKHYETKTINNVNNSNLKETFRMVLPPPNVTGNLHIGHAITVTIEDVFCRYQKYLGKKVVWYPGFDHAGIATQSVVEKKLFQETGKHRRNISNIEFLCYCEQWKNDQIKAMGKQLIALGADLDWSKIFYTMDDRFSSVVKSAFIQFYNEGLIFRDKRIVNWCPIMESTVSDQEVEIVNEKKICTRSGGEIVEIEKEQWFLHCREMHNKVMQSLKNNELKIKPDFVKSKLVEWLSYSEPWCLSRQLLWGHPIPAYLDLKTKNWIIADSKADAIKKSSSGSVLQDCDVLDTWFSSSLIPLVVAGWPLTSITAPVLEVMETGHDIIGFWVARMLTLCKKLTGYFPFTNVVLHGLVRDNTGRKMSKSLGNVIDPMDVINGITLKQMIDRLKNSNLAISEIENATLDLTKRFPKGIVACGADALRFSFLRYNLTALDITINLAKSADEGYRFCNKLWNLAKYSEKVFNTTQSIVQNDENDLLKLNEIEDRWLISRLEHTLVNYKQFMNEFELHFAFDALYKFLLNDLCDIYLETTKNALWTNDKVRLQEISILLSKVLGESFQMLLTFMPFISTYLIDMFPNQLISSKIVRNEYRNVKLEESMEFALNIVSTVRSLCNELKIPKDTSLKGYIVSDKLDADFLLSDFRKIVNKLSNFKLVNHLEVRDFINVSCYSCSIVKTPAILKIVFTKEQTDKLQQFFAKQLTFAMHRKKQFELTRDKACQKLEIRLAGGSQKAVILREIKKLQKNIYNAENIIYGMNQEIQKLQGLINELNCSSL